MTVAGNQGQNVYPAPDNYPASSFPQPIPAPDIDPDEGQLVTVQYSIWWREVLMAAADQLLNPATWQGEHDDIILALNRATNFKDLLQTDVGEMPAPYWDDESADDADDEAPIDDQPWYGQIIILDDQLTFVENAFIWAVAAFIVYAGQPGAAISFVPIARRFVIEAKKNPLGGIIKFFRDAQQIGEMDTYSPVDGVASIDIDMAAAAPGFRAFDADPPVFWLEMSDEVNPAVVGDPQIIIIRKRLDENEVYPTTMRYDETSDEFQTDFDGDDVWQDNPGLDFRHNTAYQFPPIVADDPRCQAAANMSRWVSDFLNEVTNTLGWATTAEGAFTTVMGGVALAFPEIAAVGVLAFLGLDLATTLFSAGVTAIQAAFDNDTLDLLTCIFYCHIGDDGTVTAEQLGQINADIGDQIGGLAAATMTGMFLLVGEVGVTNWGAKGEAPADCDACECGWCYTFDFTTGEQGFFVPSGAPGTYSAGVGWVGTYVNAGITSALRIQRDFDSTTIKQYDITYSVGSGGTLEGVGFVRLRLDNATKFSGDVNGNPGTYTAHFDVNTAADSVWAGSDADSSQVITRITLHGIGENPFGADNC